MRDIIITPSRRSLAESLKRVRTSRELKQLDLADAVGVNRRVVIDMESMTTDRSPLFETVQKVAAGLGYTLALVPVEAVDYVQRYKPSAKVDEHIEEIDDDGISPEVSGGRE